MVTAAPLRRDLWSRTGRPGGNAGLRLDAGWDMWRRNPSMNPSLQKATDDDVWLAELDRRNQLAQRLQAQQGGMKARSDADLLEQALNSGNVNIHEEPQNEFDEQIQEIMQGHINAGIRGQNAQFSPAVQDRIRKRKIENLQIQRAMRDQALDQAKFADQKRRQSQQFALDVTKQKQQQQYRDALVKQRQQQMAYDLGKDKDSRYQRDAKMALDLVKDGMDPNEVTQLFNLDPRDQQLIQSYAGMADGAAAAEEEPLLDYLNQRELGMRTPNQEEESWLEYGVNAPGRVAGWIGDKFGAVGDAARTAMEIIPNPFSGVAANRTYDALPLPDRSDPRLNSTLVPGSDFDKLMMEAAESGFSYDPRRGFFKNDAGGPPPPAEITQPTQRKTRPGIPVVSSGQDARRRFPSGTLVQSPDGRVFRVP